MSLVEAMERLGLKPYHLRDIILEDGHLELWHDFAVVKKEKQQQQQQANTSMDRIWNLVAQQGYQATMDAPACNHVQELLERYPNAKVVFTKRDPQKWKRSMEAIYRLIQSYDLIPFCWFSKIKMLRVSISAFLKDYGTIDPLTRLPDPETLPAYFEQYAAEIERMVPNEQLLIFEPKDGYEALCDFLAPGYKDNSDNNDTDDDDHDDDVVSNNCRQVLLENKEPYPHANDKRAIQLVVFFLRLVNIITVASPLWISGISISIWKRRNKSSTYNKNAKKD